MARPDERKESCFYAQVVAAKDRLRTDLVTIVPDRISGETRLMVLLKL